MLRLDLPRAASMYRVMAHATPFLSTPELILRMCLEAGRVMEDTSPELARALPDDSAALELRVDVLRQASEDIGAYSAAALALLRRAVEEGHTN